MRYKRKFRHHVTSTIILQRLGVSRYMKNESSAPFIILSTPIQLFVIYLLNDAVEFFISAQRSDYGDFRLSHG